MFLGDPWSPSADTLNSSPGQHQRHWTEWSEWEFIFLTICSSVIHWSLWKFIISSMGGKVGFIPPPDFSFYLKN